jgi:hypothetical protein
MKQKLQRKGKIGTYIIVTESLVLTIPPYTTPKDEVRKVICIANQSLTNLLIPCTTRGRT